MIPCKVLEIKAQSQLHSKMVSIHHGWPCLTPWSDVPYTIIALASSYCLFRLREVTICLGSKWIIYDEPILWCPRVQDAHLNSLPKTFLVLSNCVHAIKLAHLCVRSRIYFEIYFADTLRNNLVPSLSL